MDHLLAAFFAVVFAHPAARPVDTQVELPNFASHYSVAAISPAHIALPLAVNRHPASYAVARAGHVHP